MSELKPMEIDTDRLDAAHALLGVSPATVADIHSMIHKSAEVGRKSNPGRDPKVESEERSRTSSIDGKSALDALATLATSDIDKRPSSTIIPSSCVSSSSDDDSDAMPPPPPRRRNRSASNPEGMEKWDSLRLRKERRHFVLPTSIIEEELEEAKAATQAKEEEERRRVEEEAAMAARFRKKKRDKVALMVVTPVDKTPPETGSSDASISQDELLRRARSRLLEDLSEGSVQGEKGVLTLPHSLSKYRNVYNKNGRIGIYTPAERAAIIARFQHKRSRRVWNKKIRYNCRKNLADRRLRVKGRFVKRTTPEPPVLDTSDKEANFAPTDELPYRRLRRHTIT